MGVDFIAVSFVKTADVINNLKSYLNSRASKVIEIVAKVESHDSVPNCQEIIEASDAVMIARGDLGKLPHTKRNVSLTAGLTYHAYLSACIAALGQFIYHLYTPRSARS